MRVLLVLPDPLDPDSLKQRCSTLIAQGHEVGICCIVPPQAGLQLTLDAQRRVTAVLRRALEGSAERIPIFVVTEREGDRVQDCAELWGATEVRT